MSSGKNAWRVKEAGLHYLPVETRVPLKFGPETLTHVTCARAWLRVEDSGGRSVVGWGETPLSVQWVWPAAISYQEREAALKDFTADLGRLWVGVEHDGHALEAGHEFIEQRLRQALRETNSGRAADAAMPWLAALVCASPYDIALHDAFGRLAERPVYETYNADYISRDLAFFMEPAAGSNVSFAGRYPADYLADQPPAAMPAWHLVGGRDLLEEEDRTGSEPDDGYPVVLRQWIRRDGLRCLKVKLRGNDEKWDYRRLVQVGNIGMEEGVLWLTADFNCTVTNPDYVNEILDRLLFEHPRLYGMILYVEQPFPYDLEANRIDVHSVSARKPLFMDESCHDWPLIRLGRELGWTGVALKTCKTQTGALLSLCWARAHGMTLMVQDLTNPMLAQIPHCLLAAHADTIMGVETNAMQFYPEASLPEEAVHPGIYRRRHGEVDISTIDGAGFGYRLEEIDRQLPEGLRWG